MNTGDSSQASSCPNKMFLRAISLYCDHQTLGCGHVSQESMSYQSSISLRGEGWGTCQTCRTYLAPKTIQQEMLKGRFAEVNMWQQISAMLRVASSQPETVHKEYGIFLSYIHESSCWSKEFPYKTLLLYNLFLETDKQQQYFPAHNNFTVFYLPIYIYFCVSV